MDKCGQLYPRGMASGDHWIGGCKDGVKKEMSCPGLELEFLVRPTSSLVAVLMKGSVKCKLLQDDAAETRMDGVNYSKITLI
jgi:hypothetical protein